jgi:glycosyltransferase involved in cell wall biosynthesis
LIANASNKKENIKFYGFKNYFELETFYRDADIFVHPCIWPEAFGRTILEAMLFKLAIITSNRGAPQEIIGDTGLIFEAENIEDLKNKLLYFICNRDKRIKFGIASHQRAVSVYSPDNIINDIIKVYSNVIEFNNSSDRL